MKRILFFLLVLSLTLFSFQNKKFVTDFKVISASKKLMVGGAAGSPLITYYYIDVKANRNLTMVCDSAFADGRIDKFTVLVDTFKHLDQLKIKKGQMVHLTFSIIQPTQVGNQNYGLRIAGSPEAVPPIPTKTGVVLRYEGGNCRFLTISKINTLEPMYAP